MSDEGLKDFKGKNGNYGYCGTVGHSQQVTFVGEDRLLAVRVVVALDYLKDNKINR